MRSLFAIAFGSLHPAASIASTCLALCLGLSAVQLIGCTVSMADNLIGVGPLAPGATVEVPIEVSGVQRRYVVHVPQVAPNDLTKQPRPLLLLLHGSGEMSETALAQSGMDSLADENQFLIVYPSGVGGADADWNAGDCCGPAHAQGVDDVAFLKGVITDVSGRFAVDAHRIYVAGFSDGARMAYSAACRMSGTVAAVAAVSGSLTQPACVPGRAIPVIAFHGTSDASVPYDEAAHTPSVYSVAGAASLPPTIQFWLANNGCGTISSSTYAMKGPVVMSQGDGCAQDVVLYTIEHGTHNWPSPSRGSAIDASPLIVRFLLAHRAP